MSYLEKLLPEFRKGAKIRQKCWNKAAYIEFKNNDVYYNNFFTKNDKVNISKDDWELYQETIDWDYIIKNKCLCWFWDDEGDKPVICVKMIEYGVGKFQLFRADNGSCWKFCRPVRRDEVTFYEDGERLRNEITNQF